MSRTEGELSVAVVIPTHDRAEMVVDAVKSALRQTVPCRVVVVDDGSTDDTRDRLRPFGDAVTVLALENRERGAARNAGAAAAKEADILCFLDADDLLRREHVARVRSALEARPGASLVTTDALLVDADLRPMGRLSGRGAGPVTLNAFLLGRETVPPSTTAIRRCAFETVGGFDERRSLAGSEDWLLAAELLSLSPGHRLAEPTVLMRKHEGNTMVDAERMERTMLLAHRLFFDTDSANGPGHADLTPDVAERSRARLLVNAATQHYAAGEMKRTRRLLLRALRADPGVLAEPKWAWTGLRSLLGRRASGLLRSLKRRVQRVLSRSA